MHEKKIKGRKMLPQGGGCQIGPSVTTQSR